jgi:flagellar basal-body rod protein FlgB
VARDFDFSRALRDAASPAEPRPGPPRASDLMLRYAMPAQTSLDGNTVDMDRERASFADNTVKLRGHRCASSAAACAPCWTP